MGGEGITSITVVHADTIKTIFRAKTGANYQNLPGRHGQGYNEIIRELEHSLRVSIPQLYANEKFNLRIEDQTLLPVSSQLTGYSKTFGIPSSVDINSAMYGYK